jgi:pSer/pThr/pTyr-binding forkhead associated (FHA) protein
MGAILFCRTGELAGSEFTIDREATIGSGSSNTIVLTPKTISREHARIVLTDDGRYQLQDLDSSNGTRIDNRPVRGVETLGDLHVITFAEHHDFVFHAGATTAARSGAPPKPVRAAGPAEPPPPPARAPTPAPPPPPPRSADPATMYAVPEPLVMPRTVRAAAEPQDPRNPSTLFQAPEPLKVPTGVEPAAPGRDEGPANPQTLYQAPAGLVVPGGLGSGAPPAPPRDDPATMFQAPEGLVVPSGLKAPRPEDRGAPAPTSATPAPGTLGSADETRMSPRRAAVGGWFIEIQDPASGAVASTRLTDGQHRFGRSPDCDLRVDHPTLSRVHAVVTVRGGVVTVADLNSANGTFVDGAMIAATVEARAGSVLRFGEVTATLVRKP